MKRGMLTAAVVLLTAVIIGPARAENVLQLKGTLTDPASCANQLIGENTSGANTAFVGYNSPIAADVNYTIEVGDWLEYEVLIPQESTMAGGAVDMNLSARPRRAGGPELRSTFLVDQNGLSAHPGTNYARLSTRTTSVCGPDGTTTNVPMFQRGQWYKRQIDLSLIAFAAVADFPADAVAGEPVVINDISVAVDKNDGMTLRANCPDPANPNVIALFRNITIKNRNAEGQEVVKLAIYNGEATMKNGQASIPTLTHNATDGTLSVVDYTPVTTP